MKIVTISDMHGNLPQIPSADLLLIGGDICPSGRPEFDCNWLSNSFNKWLTSISIRNIVFTPGNHDFIFTSEFKDLCPKLGCSCLIDKSEVVNGIRIYGSPWTSIFFDWAFMLEERYLKDVWGKIPSNTEILLLHSPPFGIGDVASGRNKQNLGSYSLLNRIKEIKPRLVVFGHIHDGHGVYSMDSSGIITVEKTDNNILSKNNDKIYFVNASLLNDRYDFVNKPIILEYE